jgi:hypothetical protein
VDLSHHVASESLVGDLWNPIDDTQNVNVEELGSELFDDREYVIRADEVGVPIMEPTGRTLYQASAAFQVTVTNHTILQFTMSLPGKEWVVADP